MSMRVFIAGGSGFIGSAITQALLARGDTAVVLTRSVLAARNALGDTVELVEGDPTCAGEWQKAMASCDAAINLAGESIASRRWNARIRQIIHDSRVDSTSFVVDAIANAPEHSRPSVLVNASAVDFYPFAEDLGAHTAMDDDDPVDERAPPGSMFLSRVCRHWEKEALLAKQAGARVVLMRMGMVLGDGGALYKLRSVFSKFVGGRLGHGRQWMSWVHMDDVVRAYLAAVDSKDLAGPVNLVAPGTVRNRDFAKILGKDINRPSLLPAPAFAVKLALGEFAEYALNGRRVVPAVLEGAGFEFRYSDLSSALLSLEP